MLVSVSPHFHIEATITGKCRLPTEKQEHKPNRRSPSENYLGRCEATFPHYARVSSSDGQQTYLELPRTSLVAVRPHSLIASTIPSSSDGQTGTRKAKKNPRFTCGSDHSGTSCSTHNLTERNSGIKSLPNSATGTHSTVGRVAKVLWAYNFFEFSNN